MWVGGEAGRRWSERLTAPPLAKGAPQIGLCPQIALPSPTGGKGWPPPKSLLERELVGVPCVESFPQYINTPLAPLYV